MPQPHCPAQEQPAGPTPSFPPIVPVQAPSLFKVNGDAPSPRERKRRRTVSISESPSVATFSPSDTAAGIGGPAQASTDSGQPSAGRSNESVAITLSRLLGTLAANVSDSR
ncbi:uncharacterized protein LOC125944757 [Dermacentor silvarum]|uniref:uncharacterized protein LOC125944757 n=1 Tax=Dermacentor silvarum TaxID=543639 RepID=UPI00210069DC|nr:uncharacterized protein LOC125944757 [Dermacentor silvarum]